jgi:Predicted membrane protein
MIVVVIMAINAKDALGTTGSGFALSYALLRFMLVAEYIRAGQNVPEARPLTSHYSIGFGIAAGIWLVLPSRLFPGDSYCGVWHSCGSPNTSKCRENTSAVPPPSHPFTGAVWPF